MHKTGMRMSRLKKALKPRSSLSNAWRASKVKKYVGQNKIKSTGALALGIAAISGAIFGYMKRK